MADKQLVSAIRSGDRVDSYFSVTYKKPVVGYKHGHMFEFRVADRSGQVTVKYWGGEDRGAVEEIQALLERGSVVRIAGEASEFRNNIEIAVSERDGGSVAVLAPGEYDISGLLRSVEDIPAMKERLHGFVATVEEANLRSLLEAFFDDEAFMEAFSSCPASIQMHSAAVGGLLHHTLNVAEICAKVLDMRDGLDRDLVVAGALLHDIGKVRSFVVTTNINHTPEGNLIGHMAIGDEELLMRIKRIPDFPEDLALKLRHILAAHHGRREWGSTVEPMIPEALLVHEADDLDAKLDYMIERREGAETEDDWVWDRRLSRLIYLR